MSAPSLRPLRPRAASRPADCGYAVLRRVLFIHERLGNSHRVNAAGLAAALEVSPRTIKRDIAFMRDQLGAPIAWEPATRSYSYTRECDLLPLLRLDAAEALALMLAGRTFSSWGGSPLGRALAAALGKIAGVVGGAVSVPVSAIDDLAQHGLPTRKSLTSLPRQLFPDLRFQIAKPRPRPSAGRAGCAPEPAQPRGKLSALLGARIWGNCQRCFFTSAS